MNVHQIMPLAPLHALGASLAVGLALGLGLWSILTDSRGIVHAYWRKYTLSLERKLRMMFIWTPGSKIATGQLIAAAIVLMLYVVARLPFWYVFLSVIVVVPPLYVDSLRKKRVLKLESQLVDFLMALANALKSVPSISAALTSVVPLLRTPLREEILLALKEMKVGSTLEQALLNVATRVNSRSFDAALSAVMIGKQVGGDLPLILDRTAASMREMERLEGVVRSKTAEGKAQLWVLGLFPLILMFGLNAMKPGYFDPLTGSMIGYIVATIAATFWFASIVVAAKILAVDI